MKLLTPSRPHSLRRRAAEVTAAFALLCACVSHSQIPGPVPDDDPSAHEIGREFGNTGATGTDSRATVRTTPSSSFGSPWVAQGPGPATFGQVENVTPNREVSGAIHVVLPHPTNSDILYAGGTNSGIWKTTNATNASPSWTPLIDFMPSLSIGAMEFDPTDGTHQTLLAGVGRFSSFGSAGAQRAGLYRTTDGGTSWTQITGGGTLVDKNISGVGPRGSTMVVSVNFAVPFTCGNVGIFRSTNGGASFTKLNSGVDASGIPAGVINDLEGHPNDTATLYAAVVFADTCASAANGVYKSTDTGATWTKVSDASMDAVLVSGETSNVEISIFDDGVTNVVYVAILRFGQLINGGVFRSTNGGTSWTALDVPQTNANGIPIGTNPRYKEDAGVPGGQGSIHFSIQADDVADDIVYVGGDRQPDGFEEGGGFQFPNSLGAQDYSGRLFRGDASQSSGSQWVHLTHVQNQVFTGGGTANSSAPHADSREIAFDANGVMVEGDDGGIYRRTSAASNTGDWFSINGNIQPTEIHDVAYDSLSNIIISGNQDTGTTYQSSSGSTTWTSFHTGDGGDVAVDNITNAGSNQSIRYTSFQNLGAFRRSIWDASGAFVSQSFPALTGLTGGVQFVTPVELNNITPSRLVIGGDTSVHESTNSGTNVTPLTPAFTANAMDYGGVSSSVNNVDVLWVGGSAGVMVRTGAGTVLSSTSYAGGTVIDILMDPSDWQIAYVIDSAGTVHRTANSGASFTNVTGTLMDVGALRSLEYLEGNSDDYLLVGADAGVFVAPLSGLSGTFQTWFELGDNLPNAPAYDMDYDAGDDVLVVGTLGRGAWKVDGIVTLFETTPQASLDVYVDAAHTGLELGTQSQPFKTLAAALPFVLTGGTLHVTPGTYAESPVTVNQNLTIEREGSSGTVTIQ